MKQLRPKEQKKPRDAQRAWIKMRDIDCGWAFTDIRDCLMDRTDNRTSELKNSWFFTKNGEYISNN